MTKQTKHNIQWKYHRNISVLSASILQMILYPYPTQDRRFYARYKDIIVMQIRLIWEDLKNKRKSTRLIHKKRLEHSPFLIAHFGYFFISFLRWKNTFRFITHMSENTTNYHQWTSLVINAQMYILISKKGINEQRYTIVDTPGHPGKKKGVELPRVRRFPGYSVSFQNLNQVLWT